MATELAKCVEFKPVLNKDNTEVKVPVNVRSSIAGNEGETIIEASFSCGQDQPHKDVLEYNRLSNLYKELPCELFVSRLLRDYASCENRLDSIRHMLFDIIRECDDFPYGLQADLKRRVATRRGDPLAVKLANDIYIILSVLEGDDFALLKELLSAARGRTVSQSRNSTIHEPLSSVGKNISCNCSQEIPVLRDTIASLQADLLLLKQRTFACEKLRSDEMKQLISSLVLVKGEVVTRFDSAMLTFSSSIESIKSHMSTQPSSDVPDADNRETLRINSKIDELDSRLQRFENIVEDAEVVAMNINAVCRINQTEKPASPMGDISADTPHDDVSDLLNSACAPETELSTNPTSIIHSVPTYANPKPSSLSVSDIDALEHFLHSSPIKNSDEHKQQVVNVTGHASSTPKASHQDIHQHIRVNAKKPPRMRNVPCNNAWAPVKHVSFAEIRRALGTPSAPRKNGIPVRITNRNQYSRESYSEKDSEFITHVKKPPQRYFVGGFKNTITHDAITGYITRRGIKVSMVRIFACKRSPGDVIIRVNIEEGDNSSHIEQSSFWPEGVSCKPWLNRSTIKGGRNPPMHRRPAFYNSEDQYRYAGTVTGFQCPSDIETYNIYNHLGLD